MNTWHGASREVTCQNNCEHLPIRALVSARGSEQRTEKTKAESEIEVALASATICFHYKNRKSQSSRGHKRVSSQPIYSKIATGVLILVTNNLSKS